MSSFPPAPRVPPPPSSPLERHQRRREQGIPTLSVLAGPPAAALALWSGWLGARDQPLALWHGSDARGAVREWLTVLERTRPLGTLAADFLGRSAGLAPGALPARLLGKTEHERDVLLQALAPGLPPGEPGSACLRLLRLAQVVHKSGGAPDALLAEWDAEPARVLAAVHGLMPGVMSGGLAPALLLTGPAEGPWLADAARLATRICDAVPALAVALQADPAGVDAYLRGGESQARALVREGRVGVEARSREEVERRLTALGLPEAHARGGALAPLAEEGVPDEVLVRYAEAAREGEAAQRAPEAEDRARSSAERFLYALLEALPETRGLFELNARAEFLLRGRPVEVDFLSRTLGVAIEVDGYHHFRGEDDYRRDRRKDLALQRHGYWVVRWLAQDVVARLEEIRDTLREVVSLRRQHPGGLASPKEAGDAGA